MSEFKRKHRRKKLENPLVPIVGDRVRAAVEWRGLSVNAAATASRIPQQTLDSIVRGETKRCHRDRRDKLAELLALPPEWLGGETDLMPSLTPWPPYPGLDYTPPITADEMGRVHRVPDEGPTTQRFGLPPRYQLAAAELTNRVIQAWQRDIDKGSKEAQEVLLRLSVGEWKARPWDLVAMLVHRLISLFWWRRFFFRPPLLPKPIDPNVSDEEWKAAAREQQSKMAKEATSTDALATSGVKALSAALEPWFQGTRELRYERLDKVLCWAWQGFGLRPELLVQEDSSD